MGTALCRLLLSCGCLLLSVCGADPDDVKKAREEMGSADPSSLLAGMLAVDSRAPTTVTTTVTTTSGATLG